MPPKHYGVGDLIFFRSGAHAKWHVEGYVKKVAFCRQTNPIGFNLVMRAVNKLKRMSLKLPAVLQVVIGKPAASKVTARTYS
jgi:hypothetical protein